MVTSTPKAKTPSCQWNGSHADWLAFGLLAVATLIIRAPWFGDANADIDEQLYSLIGNAMTQGALPYVDLWDRKPFGLFAIYAVAHAVGGPGPIAYQMLAALFIFASAMMGFTLARCLVDRVTAFGAGFLIIALMSTYGALSGNSEAFFVPMMVAMALLVRNHDHPQAVRRAVLAMLIGGLALQVKYTAIPQCLFFGLWVLWGAHRNGAAMPRLVALAAAFGALGLLPTALVAGGYALTGYWDAWLFANITSFFDRMPSDAGRLYTDLVLFLMPLVLLAAGGMYAAVRMTPPRDRQTYMFYLLWFVACLATIFLPATVYRYYFAAVVPATVLVALPLLDRRGPAGIAPLVLLVAGASYILFLPHQIQQSQTQRAALDRLAHAISAKVDSKQNCLWVYDGPTSLYRLSGSCLPTRFIYPDHLNNLLESGALGVSQTAEVARILATKPPVIVTADTAFTPQNKNTEALVKAAIDRDYLEIADETLHKRKIRVWARRAADSPSAKMLDSNNPRKEP
ncbi:hypothetical protein [Erythrobacter sp.]|uniref:ArnT family glycosyltransferase n=1 Tax=Erythrobacter sp. TaxID=1042 RepID=UPI00311FE502